MLAAGVEGPGVEHQHHRKSNGNAGEYQRCLTEIKQNDAQINESACLVWQGVWPGPQSNLSWGSSVCTFQDKGLSPVRLRETLPESQDTLTAVSLHSWG